MILMMVIISLYYGDSETNYEVNDKDNCDDYGNVYHCGIDVVVIVVMYSP